MLMRHVSFGDFTICSCLHFSMRERVAMTTVADWRSKVNALALAFLWHECDRANLLNRCLLFTQSAGEKAIKYGEPVRPQ